MKKILIVILLLIPSLGWADDRLAWHGAIMGGGVAAAPTGDSCTGGLLFSWHMEDADDVTAGTPAGCVVAGGDGDATLNSDAVLSTTQAKDGTYSLSIPSTYDFAAFDVSSENIVKGELGSVSLWIYIPSTGAIREIGNIAYTDASNYIFAYVQSNDTIRMTYRVTASVNCNSVGTVTTGWYYIAMSWSTAGVDGHYQRIGVNTTGDSPSYTNCDSAISDIGSPVIVRIGDVAANSTGGYYIDNFKIYSSW